jgi:hypothetical protein
MKDLIVIVMTVAFFAVTVGYVVLCDRIIGPDEVDDSPADVDDLVPDDDIGGDAGDRPDETDLAEVAS